MRIPSPFSSGLKGKPLTLLSSPFLSVAAAFLFALGEEKASELCLPALAKLGLARNNNSGNGQGVPSPCAFSWGTRQGGETHPLPIAAAVTAMVIVPS